MTRRYTGGLLSATEQATDANTANGIFTLQEAGALTTAGNFPTGRWTPQRSLRFRASSSAYLTRTLTTPTSAKAWTFSAWVKRAKIGSAQSIFISTLGGAGVPQASSYFTSSDTIQIYDYTGSAYTFDLTTSQTFKDTSAWYHLVFVYDSAANATSNRVRLYVNGTQITSFSSASFPSLNADCSAFNRAYAHYLSQGNAQYFDGYMAEVNFIDGQALDPSYFGATDPETGTWVPKRYVGTYGNNGSYLPFSDNTATSTLGKSFAPNNYFTYSEQFDNVAWSKYQSSVTANAAVAPDGATTADKLVGTTGTSGDHQVYQSGMVTAVDNGVYTLSCYAKAAERSVFRLYILKRDGATYAYGDFNLNTGQVDTTGGGPYAGATQTITSVGNGWYRCSITVNVGTGAGGVNAILSYASSSGETAGYGLYIWGAQINIGSTALDYTATTSSASANDWTGNNFSLTSGVTYDSMVDVPGIASVTSQPDIGGVQRGNYATWSQLTPPTQTSLSQGNLFSTATGSSTNVITTFPTPTTGKWYAEITMNFSQNINWPIVMGVSDGISGNTYLRYYTDWSARAINKSVNGVTSSVTPSGALPVNGDILKIAYDADAGNLWLGLNSTWYGASGSLTGAPETGNDPTLSGVARKEMYPNHNSAGGPAQNAYLNCGQRPFTYTPPTGFKSLNTTNFPNPVIKRPSEHFDVKTWVGNGVNQMVGVNPKQLPSSSINKSLRFKSNLKTYLTRTPASASNRQTWTWSGWVKRGLSNTRMTLMGGYTGTTNGTLRTEVIILDGGALQVYSDQMQTATDFTVVTNQIFKDTSAWYHFVAVLDTTQTASTSRVKLYVNGTQISSFSTATYPSLNYQGGINSNNLQYINRYYDPSGGNYYGDGYLADVHFIDGQALTPSSFGTFDANNNWAPKAYTGTYGTNGYKLDFNDTRSPTTAAYDVSGNSNHWTPLIETGIASAVWNTAPTAANAPNVLYYGTPGTYTWTAPAGVTSVTYLVVGGGGGGGNGVPTRTTGAGGGAGGYLTGTLSVTPSTSYTVTVGAGGLPGTSPTNGGNSVFASITALGGGYGAHGGQNGAVGGTGGSGGGTSGPFGGGTTAGGLGTAGQGNNGGVASQFSMSGGGGAGQVGGNSSPGGYGGNGLANTITGVSVYYAGGGGGSIGGLGGGGRQADNPSSGTPARPGTDGLGGGGGGGSNPTTAAARGGSGVVILSYTDAGSYVGNGAGSSNNNDSSIDVPVDKVDSLGNSIGNYATLNPNFNIGSATISNGGLTLSSDTSGAHKIVPATLPVSKGKWYFEMSLVTSCSNAYAAMGFIPYPTPSSTYYTNLPSSVSGSDGFSWQTGSGNNSFWFDYTSSAQFVTVATGSASAVGDKLQIAIDIDNNKIWAGRNNTWYDASGGSTGNPSTGANPTATNVINYISKYGALVPYCSIGQGNTIIANFGQSPFAYTPPTGFKSINTKNLNDVGSSNLPNNYGNFVNTPDLVWLKSSSSASYGHRLTDTVRGPTRQLLSHDTGAQSTDANGLQAFLPNGFNVGSGGDYNTASQTYVSWNWNRGKIPGFDIVNYSGNGGVQTINHNLGVAPSWLVVKKLSTATNSNWMVYHSSLGPTKALNLNNTSTAGTTYWNSTSPTSNTFTLDSNGNYNSINDSYIAYLWAEVPGFSKFGAYTNNNSTDGVFIYTGFRPKFVLIKNHDNVEEWYILDSVRQTYNQAPPMSSSFLKPNSASGSSGSTTSGIDLLSNGFKIRTTNPASGEIGFGTRGYIYCAFAETPFKYANAR